MPGAGTPSSPPPGDPGQEGRTGPDEAEDPGDEGPAVGAATRAPPPSGEDAAAWPAQPASGRWGLPGGTEAAVLPPPGTTTSPAARPPGPGSPPTAFDTWRRWPEPRPEGPKEPDPSGNPWLVVLAVGLALILLAAAAVGLRVAAGPEPIPLPDREMVPYPGASLPTAPYTVDTTPPGLLVDDVNGQFRVTVPRTWPIDPNPEPDRTSWMPPVRLATGGLAQAGFTFTVRWGTSSGCTLEACAMRALDALLAQNPASPSLQPDSIGGLDAIRLEAIFSNKLVVAWVVVKEDRYWTILLSGPPDGFDDMLAFVRTIVVSMSFG